jgi:hypothetical protein
MKPRSDQGVAADNRRNPRLLMEDEVTVTFAADTIKGPGKNISTQGLYFTTAGSLRVQVKVAGSDQPVPAELIRLESMGDGRIGIALRFLDRPSD